MMMSERGIVTKEEGPSAVEKEARMMLSVRPMSAQKCCQNTVDVE
jgi:hypothetical protein